MRQQLGRPAASILIGLATAVVVLAIAVVPFLNPLWVGFEQGRSGAAQLTGFTADELRTATNAILWDLVVGPPDFDGEIGGAAVLNDEERGHMRDVRGAFGGFGVLVAVAAAALLVGRRLLSAEAFWRSVRTGAALLAAALVGLAIVAAVAFDAAFEIFHRLLFAGGTYAFDPATDRLVQLFPMTFWFETSIAVGAVAVLLGLATAGLAGRRGAARSGRPTIPTGVAAESTR